MTVSTYTYCLFQLFLYILQCCSMWYLSYTEFLFLFIQMMEFQTTVILFSTYTAL